MRAAPAPAHPRPAVIVMTNHLWEWAVAIAGHAALVLFMLEYHRLWRAKGYALNTLNEALAIAGTCGVAVALLLGRFGRLGVLRFRRPAGVTAVAVLALHGLISLVWFQKYQLAWTPLGSLALGVLALGGLVSMWVLSYRWAVARLGPDGWKSMQRWGYLFLAAGLAHFVVLGKIPGWIGWLQTFDKPAPPGTIIPFAVGVAALLAKGAASLARRRAAVIQPA